MRPLLALLLLALVGLPLLAVSAYRAGKEAGRDEVEDSRPLPSAAPPVCGCSHSLALHDLKTGRCYASKVFDGWTVRHPYGESVAAECACRQYIGPEHPAMYAGYLKDWSGDGGEQR